MDVRAFPISLKYAPDEACVGSNHSTDSAVPHPGTRIVTPGEFVVVRVTLSYNNSILSTQQSIINGTSNSRFSQILKKSAVFFWQI